MTRAHIMFDDIVYIFAVRLYDNACKKLLKLAVNCKAYLRCWIHTYLVSTGRR